MQRQLEASNAQLKELSRKYLMGPPTAVPVASIKPAPQTVSSGKEMPRGMTVLSGKVMLWGMTVLSCKEMLWGMTVSSGKEILQGMTVLSCKEMLWGMTIVREGNAMGYDYCHVRRCYGVWLYRQVWRCHGV